MALAVVCIAVASVASAAQPGTAGAQDTGTAGALDEDFATGGSAAVEYLADCVSSGNRLLAQFLVDESGSLDDTDEPGRRVDALKVAIRSLDSIHSSDPENPTPIDVAITAFAQTFTDGSDRQPEPGTDLDDLEPVEVEWTPLGGGAADAQVALAESFRTRNNGFDTDYHAALTGAQTAFAQRSAALAENGEPEPCKVLFWFTDGEYDIVDRVQPGQTENFGATKPYSDVTLGVEGSGELVEQDGMDALCSAGGPIDQLRADGVVVAPFALTTAMDPGDEAFLLRAAGVGTDPCGERTPSDGSAPGLYFGSSQVSDVIAAFDALANQLANGNPAGGEPRPVCSLGNVTDECVEHFEVDPIFSRFHVLALTGAENIRVELRAPGDGAPLSMDPVERGTGELAGAEVRWVWVAPDAVQIDVDLPDEPGDWVGTWSVTFIDFEGTSPSAVARANIHLFGDFDVSLADDPSFRRGETATFDGSIRRREGTPINEDLFDQLGLRAFITDPQTGDRTAVEVEQPDSEGNFSGTVDVPVSMASSAANLTVQLEPVTQDGVALKPEPQTFSVAVLPPLRYPRIEPAEFDMPAVKGDDSTSITFQIIASDDAGGCVWVEGVDFAEASNPADDVRAVFDPASRDRTSCLAVEAGGNRSVELTLDPATQGEGTQRGVVHFALTADGDQEVAPLNVPVTFTMSFFVDTGVQRLLAALFMALSVAIVLAILYFANWLTARFAAPGQLRYADLDVIVGASSVSRQRGGDLTLGPDDFKRALDDMGSPRWFKFGAVRFDARVHPNPFRRPQASVSWGGGKPTRRARKQVGAKGLVTRDGARSGSAPTRLVLREQWVFLPDAAPSSDGQPGRLLAFVQIGKAKRDIATVQRSIQDLPAAWAEYQATVAATPGREPRASSEPTTASTKLPTGPTRRDGGQASTGAGVTSGGRPTRRGRAGDGGSDGGASTRPVTGPPSDSSPPASDATEAEPVPPRGAEGPPRRSGGRGRGSTEPGPARPPSARADDEPTEDESSARRRRPPRRGTDPDPR